MDQALHRRLLTTWASDAAAFAEVLAELEPGWGSEVHAVGGGWLVLFGKGLYVNRAIAVGLDAALTEDDVDLVVDRSAAAGVTPAIEVTEHTHPGTITLLDARGFDHDRSRDVTALVRPPTAPPVEAPADVRVRSIDDDVGLPLWQAMSATGWGHTDSAARRASDAYALAAHAIDGDGMVVAFDADDDCPLGCASTTVREGMATLGGMSTAPSARRRGVHAALIRHRLDLAAERGCDVTASSAATGGASERNLVRHGFAARFVVRTFQLASPA